MHRYEPHEIEQRWQARWAEDRLYEMQAGGSGAPYYLLLMFPYPSGPLHCGHWFMYAPPDAKVRYLRMKGHDVFCPMGFDGFGLPAENAAIKRGTHPKKWTYENIEQMRRSFRSMGASFDFSHEVITCDPGYYKWTQWLFLELFEHDLAYRTRAPVDWCPSCNTTLAREQIVGAERVCERCSTPVIKRELDQWLFRITKYAEELLDFSSIDWPERVESMQSHWIGRTEGLDIDFATETGDTISVFTTRPDTICGVTFLVVAPEHPLVERVTLPEFSDEVTAYVEQAKRQTEIERLAVKEEKTGVFTGAYALNPFTGERVPIYVGDYVLVGHGTGAVMGVPAHDQRDFDFAKTAGLEVKLVVSPPVAPDGPLSAAYEGEGPLVSSGEFDGLVGKAAMEAIARSGEERKVAHRAVHYRLRDWLVSRQRYWGAPIPVIHCSACGAVPVPREDLPVRLPDDVDFVPTGVSPLKSHAGFVNVSCPRCGGAAERDTDTLDTFVDSSFYWYRYLNPHDDDHFCDPIAAARWLPVTEYAGGIEHATMHLLYARFMAKALCDLGHVEDREPFARLFNQGIVLGEDGEKMSKSRGNVVDPDSVVKEHGSDVFRAFLMFLGPWSRGGAWSSEGIVGIVRFFQRVWNLVLAEADADMVEKAPSSDELRSLRRAVHGALEVVSRDIERFQFNTALSALMELVNTLTDLKRTPLAGSDPWRDALGTLVLMLAPIAPHLAEELWEKLGRPYSVHRARWPVFDPSAVVQDRFVLVIQVNGKVRGKTSVPLGISEAEATRLALDTDSVRRFLDGAQPKRVIFVPDRLINLIV